MDFDEQIKTITVCVVAACVGLAILFAQGIGALFRILGKTFDSFGVMMLSIGGFLIQTGKLIVIASFTVGVTIAFVYALIKFVRLMNKSTEFMKTYKDDSEAFQKRLKREHNEFERRIDRKIEFIRETLDEALSEPEIAPQAQLVASAPSLPSAQVSKEAEGSEVEAAAQPQTMSHAPAERPLEAQVGNKF